MAYDTTTRVGYAVLYCVLGIFTLIAIASANYFYCCLPKRLNDMFVMRLSSGDGDVSEEVDEGKSVQQQTDFYLSARNSASSTAIALSFFASGMGAWVIYGPTEMGANPNLSWLGVIGYSFASAAPAFVVFLLGPKIKSMCEETSFSFTDFARKRYGRIMQAVVAVLSIFYMFIYIVAEMTAISNIYALVCNNLNLGYTTSIAISMGVFTLFYTSLAGLPASIVTDRFQGIMMGVLVLLLLFAVTLNPENRITREQFALASNWTGEGIMAAVTLFLAILSAEMFNLGTWQRVWAAESVPAMRRGFASGSLLVFLLMMFFGIMGMIAYANDPSAYDSFEKFSFLAFFDLLEPLANAWHIITLILVTALAASSIDTLQNALISTFSADLIKSGRNPKWIARGFVLAINIPAIAMSAKGFDVIALFLIADLVCATSVLPVFLGLITEDKVNGWIPAPTELGAFLGCISGVLTVMVIGAVVQAPGGVLQYFWLQNDAICALCGSKTMITFIITPISSAIFTLLFSKLDIFVRGDAARRPLIGFCEKLVERDQDGIKVDVEHNEDHVDNGLSVKKADDGFEGPETADAEKAEVST